MFASRIVYGQRRKRYVKIMDKNGAPDVTDYQPPSTPDDVVAFLGDQLERQGREPVAGLAVNLKPLLHAAPPGEERAEVHEVIESCEDSYGYLQRSGGMGFELALTPAGSERYRQIKAARQKALLARRQPLVRAGMAADRWLGEQRRLLPHLSPVIEKVILSVLSFVAGLVLGLLL